MKETYGHTWERCTKTERVKIRSKKSPYNFETTQITKEHFTTFSGSFLVEIDIDSIARMLMGRAAHSKSGRSVCLSGMCKAKRLIANAVATRTKEYPPPNTDIYEVVEDLAS